MSSCRCVLCDMKSFWLPQIVCMLKKSDISYNVVLGMSSVFACGISNQTLTVWCASINQLQGCPSIRFETVKQMFLLRVPISNSVYAQKSCTCTWKHANWRNDVIDVMMRILLGCMSLVVTGCTVSNCIPFSFKPEIQVRLSWTWPNMFSACVEL